ncbi:MAG: Gldg family protein [Clostridia bacterium]|nr:Gldg family protein [Clostridia bacterium]
MPVKKSYFRIAGKYAAFGAAALVLVILINTLAGGLSCLRLDVSGNGLYTPSSETAKVLSSLKSDIMVYAVGSETTAAVRIREIAEKFAAAGPRVKFDYIAEDAAAYVTGGTPAVSDMIVTDGQYSVIIPSSETIAYSVSTDENGKSQVDGLQFTAEQQLLTAVEAITADSPMAYYLSGHGESEPESSLDKTILKNHYHYQALYLYEISDVPEDCGLIFINAPTTDITDKERDLLIRYLGEGGNIVLVTDSKTKMGANLASVAAYAGLAEKPGVIVEGDTGHMYDKSYPYYLLADYAEGGKAIPVLMGLAHGIEMTGAEGFETRAVLISSEKSFLKPGARSDGVITYAEGDETGPFTLAALSKAENGGKLFWVASGQCMIDSIDTMVSGSNYSLLGSVIADMRGEAEPFTQVEGKPYEPVELNISGPVPGLILLCTAVILIAAGIIVSAKKRSAKIEE